MLHEHPLCYNSWQRCLCNSAHARYNSDTALHPGFKMAKLINLLMLLIKHILATKQIKDPLCRVNLFVLECNKGVVVVQAVKYTYHTP